MSGCNCTGYCYIHGHCPNGEPFKALTPLQHEALTKQLEQVRLLKQTMDMIEERIAKVHENLAEARDSLPEIENRSKPIEEPSTNMWIHFIGVVICLTIVVIFA